MKPCSKRVTRAHQSMLRKTYWLKPKTIFVCWCCSMSSQRIRHFFCSSVFSSDASILFAPWICRRFSNYMRSISCRIFPFSSQILNVSFHTLHGSGKRYWFRCVRVTRLFWHSGSTFQNNIRTRKTMSVSLLWLAPMRITFFILFNLIWGKCCVKKCENKLCLTLKVQQRKATLHILWKAKVNLLWVGFVLLREYLSSAEVTKFTRFLCFFELCLFFTSEHTKHADNRPTRKFSAIKPIANAKHQQS